MKEIEVKFSAQSFAPVRKRLKELGASLGWRGIEKSIYFDTPDGSFERSDRVLRLKQGGGHHNDVVFKGRARGTHYKEREEITFHIDDADAFGSVLEEMGFAPAFVYEKSREHWKLKKASIELDALDDMKFVEIEGSKKTINMLAEELGLSWDHSTTESYTQLVKKRRNEQ